MHVSVNGKSDRFNLSVVGEDFINDCCFGEDFSRWLVQALQAAGVEAGVICMEDFGWANFAVHEGITYFVAVAGVSDEIADRPDYGQWRVMIERKRSLVDRIRGRNRTTAADALCGKVAGILRDARFDEVSIEP
jgi:hypothetical protein